MAELSTTKINGNISATGTVSGTNITTMQNEINELNDNLISFQTIVNKQLTPKIYSKTGYILKSISGTGTAQGYGRLTVFIESSGLVRIEFGARVTSNGTIENVYDFGISLSDILSIDTNMPSFKPNTIGICNIYYDGSSLGTTHNGYCGAIATRGQGDGWSIGRFYNTSGDFGAWADATFQEGMYVTGNVYGIVQ